MSTRSVLIIALLALTAFVACGPRAVPLLSTDGAVEVHPDASAQGDASVDTPAAPLICESKGYSCAGPLVVECQSAGQPPVGIVDCRTLNFADLKFSCAPCADTPTPVVCRANKPAATGYLNWPGHGAFVSTPGCAKYPKASTVFVKDYSPWFRHAIAYAPFTHYASFNFPASSIESGKPTPLYSSGLPPSGWTATITNNGVVCRASPAAAPPPSAGSVVLSWTGQEQGARYNLDVDGYLTCDNGKTWSKMSYHAEGYVGTD